jgi:ABC-2 type transport system permease protein
MVGLGSYFASDPSHWFNYISMTKHYQSFTRGVFDSADIIYYLLFIVTFLVLTVRRLDSDRVRG